MGCTKKHAKCAWREVREEEMFEGREEHGDDGIDDEDDDGQGPYHGGAPTIAEGVSETHEENDLREETSKEVDVLTEQVSRKEADTVLLGAEDGKTEHSVQEQGAGEEGERIRTEIGHNDNSITSGHEMG